MTVQNVLKLIYINLQAKKEEDQDTFRNKKSVNKCRKVRFEGVHETKKTLFQDLTLATIQPKTR